MGNITMVIEVQDEKANVKLSGAKPNVIDYSVAIAQLELMKLNLLGRISKHSRIKNNDL